MSKFAHGQQVRVTKSPYLSLPQGTIGTIVELLPWEPWANDGLVRVSFHGTTTRWALLQSWLEPVQHCGLCHGEGSLDDEYDDDEGRSVPCFSPCHSCGGSGVV